MKRKQKEEIQEVFKKYIKYIENNLDSAENYVCNMKIRIGYKLERGVNGEFIFKKCGFNRMINEAVDYFKSERPTSTKNKEFYNNMYFIKNLTEFEIKECPWWEYANCADINISVNMEKIRFLKHLIKKLD